jgi:hypothetical protein
LLAALPLLAASSAAAEDGFSFKLQAGYADLTNAKASANAVFGSSGGLTYGAEISYGLGDHLFVSVGGRYFKKDGERVFVADPSGPVFRLGHPLSVRIIPVYATLGYRFEQRSHRSPFVPYLGISAGSTSYHEESTVAGLSETSSENKLFGQLVGGVEFGRGGVRVALEGAYAQVPSTIGIAGVSRVYNEKDIGGFSVVAKVIFAQPHR